MTNKRMCLFFIFEMVFIVVIMDIIGNYYHISLDYTLLSFLAGFFVLLMMLYAIYYFAEIQREKKFYTWYKWIVFMDCVMGITFSIVFIIALVEGVRL